MKCKFYSVMEFKEISMEDKELFNSYLKEYPKELSKLNFTTLFCWQEQRGIVYAEHKGHLIVKDKDRYYEPIGPKPAEMIKEILDDDPEGYFEKVSEEVADELEGLKIEERRDLFDYVYDAEEMKELKGTKFEEKRQHINKFMKNNPQTCFLDNFTKEDFKSLQERWYKMMPDEQLIKDEDKSLKIALDNFSELELMGVCVRVNEELVGFAIGERTKEGTFAEHYEKADRNYKGAYQYVLWEFCKHLPEDVKLLNRGQDIGIPGMRKAKESYHPVKMVKKYSVSKK
ncbi:MAG: DUF2156 domain-containing protein [Nanobdellota archaeon]